MIDLGKVEPRETYSCFDVVFLRKVPAACCTVFPSPPTHMSYRCNDAGRCGTVSEYQSGLKQKRGAVGSEGTIEMLAAMVLWMESWLNSNGCAAADMQTAKQQGMPDVGAPALEQVTVVPSFSFDESTYGWILFVRQRGHRVEISHVGRWRPRVVKVVHGVEGSDKEFRVCTFKR